MRSQKTEPGRWSIGRFLRRLDVRLVLAERLDIRDDADADNVHLMQDWSQAEDVESYLALVYNFTTWLQESLVQAMVHSLDARH